MKRQKKDPWWKPKRRERDEDQAEYEKEHPVAGYVQREIFTLPRPTPRTVPSGDHSIRNIAMILFDLAQDVDPGPGHPDETENWIGIFTDAFNDIRNIFRIINQLHDTIELKKIEIERHLADVEALYNENGRLQRLVQISGGS